MSKAILNYFGFAFLRSVIGLETSRHLLNQSYAKLKPITTWSHAFSRAWDRLRVFTLSSHWLLVISTFVLIGCFTLVLVLRHSIEKRSKQVIPKMCQLMFQLCTFLKTSIHYGNENIKYFSRYTLFLELPLEDCLLLGQIMSLFFRSKCKFRSVEKTTTCRLCLIKKGAVTVNLLWAVCLHYLIHERRRR